MGSLLLMLKKILSIGQLIKDKIDETVKAKQDKARDRAEKDMNRQFNDISGPDPKKPAEPEKDDIGKALSDVIAEAMSTHAQASVEMQQSINKLRGFAPDEINYPSDTDALVKQYMAENGGKSNASIDTLRNTGYLMQGQQQIGQTVQLTGQAIAGMAQNMDQSFQGALEFMQEVPDTMNEAIERQEDGLEDFLKEWRRGQEKQFKFFSFLKGAAMKPFEIAKIGISAAEKAQMGFKIVQETIINALGKGAAFKVIFKQLGDNIPFIGELRKKIINLKNIVPNMIDFIRQSSDAIKAKLDYAGFNIKGMMLHALGNLPIGGKAIRDSWTNETKQLVEDWEVLHDSASLETEKRKLEDAKQTFARKIDDNMIQKIENKLGRTLADNELAQLKEGDASNLLNEYRGKIYNEDPTWQQYKKILGIIDGLKHATSGNPYILEYDGPFGIKKKISINKTVAQQVVPFLESAISAADGDYLTSVISSADDAITAISKANPPYKDQYNVIKNKVLWNIPAIGNLSDQDLADDLGIKAIKEVTKHQTEVSRLSNLLVGQQAEVLERRSLEIDSKGHITTKAKMGNWKQIQEENLRLENEGTDKLEGIIGAPNQSKADADFFIKNMIWKYQLEEKSPQDIMNRFFLKKKDDPENPSKLTFIRINDKAVTELLKHHPEIGFTVWKTAVDGNMAGKPVLTDNDSYDPIANVYYQFGKRVDTGYEIRNQRENAWKEFDEDGNVIEGDFSVYKPQPSAMPTDSNSSTAVPPEMGVPNGTATPTNELNPEEIEDINDPVFEQMKKNKSAADQEARLEKSRRIGEQLRSTSEYKDYSEKYAQNAEARKEEALVAYDKMMKRWNVPDEEKQRVYDPRIKKILDKMKTDHHKDWVQVLWNEIGRIEANLYEKNNHAYAQRLIDDSSRKFDDVFGEGSAALAFKMAAKTRILDGVSPITVLSYFAPLLSNPTFKERLLNGTFDWDAYEQGYYSDILYDEFMKNKSDPTGELIAERKHDLEADAVWEKAIRNGGAYGDHTGEIEARKRQQRYWDALLDDMLLSESFDTMQNKESQREVRTLEDGSDLLALNSHMLGASWLNSENEWIQTDLDKSQWVASPAQMKIIQDLSNQYNYIESCYTGKWNSAETADEFIQSYLDRHPKAYWLSHPKENITDGIIDSLSEFVTRPEFSENSKYYQMQRQNLDKYYTGTLSAENMWNLREALHEQRDAISASDTQNDDRLEEFKKKHAEQASEILKKIGSIAKKGKDGVWVANEGKESELDQFLRDYSVQVTLSEGKSHFGDQEASAELKELLKNSGTTTEQLKNIQTALDFLSVLIVRTAGGNISVNYQNNNQNTNSDPKSSKDD